ncbi:MAG: hypothetical protein GC160_14095 [Acidobacteria bacterium]|nr:hypothetical protein [Acidobacteriota bacterium]
MNPSASLLESAVVSERGGPLVPASSRRFLEELGVDPNRPETLPFGPGDVTAGSESELQAAVLGEREDVDLPQAIERSNFFANSIRRAAAGDAPRGIVSALEDWLETNRERVWDNSFVRFPRRTLSAYANSVFENDLRADKSDPGSPRRADAGRFTVFERGEELVRIPISYLLKLALADALGVAEHPPDAIRAPGVRLMGCFLNDNTSPETLSFHTPRLLQSAAGGAALARESAKRYLFSQLLISYANRVFELEERGQRALLYASPHPPVRQRQLNDCISDSFYRELFMSPCLSGWDRGEQKRDYMGLCHQTLSRSQLNAIGKLREAGIITRNLVVLPNTSNVSLANNGVHVSLGSNLLSDAAAAGPQGFSPAREKNVGDLVIKIVEHFLPLFVGTYSAAPYRMAYQDFHPERALSFLPHELDYTHLRMLWRRWKGKARIRIFGHPFCPLGPAWIDRAMAGAFGLKGDFIPDFRLIDYLVAPMSTERSPALDGSLGNEARLLEDLDHLGVFDARMSLYLLYRLRDRRTKGYSGFEGRYYSLFESYRGDMAQAVNLQHLVTALAYRYVASGAVTHGHIPDRPGVESERRQILFGAAVGIPTFFVNKDSSNSFLLDLVRRAQKVRLSRRYPGRLRVVHREYQRALLAAIRADGADLVEALGMEETLADLEQRLVDPEASSAGGKLTRGILATAGARNPFSLTAREFNQSSEQYYRGELRLQHMREAFDELLADYRRQSRTGWSEVPEAAEALRHALGETDPGGYLERAREDLLADRLPAAELRRILHLMLVAEHVDAKTAV